MQHHNFLCTANVCVGCLRVRGFFYGASVFVMTVRCLLLAVLGCFVHVLLVFCAFLAWDGIEGNI